VFARAVSGRTFAPLWTSAPIARISPNNVAVVGNRVVISSRDSAEVLDLATGRSLRTVPSKGTPTVCESTKHPGTALILPGVALDVETGAKSAPEIGDICRWMAPNGCAVSKEPCLADGMEDRGVTARDHKVHGWTTLIDGPSRVSYGFVLPSKEHMVAAGATRGSTRATWERAATLEGEPIASLEYVTNYQSMMAALNGSRFVLAYGIHGAIRILSRDAATGQLLWSATLPGRPRNTALRATPSRIYIHADWQIHVIDASSGELLGTL
jgi:hypothetical protein